jgi:hypothetical protein
MFYVNLLFFREITHTFEIPNYPHVKNIKNRIFAIKFSCAETSEGENFRKDRVDELKNSAISITLVTL